MALTLDPALESRLVASLAADAPADERERAFEEVFRALRAPILALCLQLTGSRAEAEDALQETFLSVHRALPAFRGDSKLSTWIWRIAIRAAIRVRARRPRHEPLEAEPAAPSSRDPAVAAEERTRLAAAMERLPAEQRLVLSLFAIEGLSHKDIAELLRIPEGTVWSRLHIARKRLAAELQGVAGR